MEFVANFDKDREDIYKNAIILTKANVFIKEEAYWKGTLNPKMKSLWLKDGHENEDLSNFWDIIHNIKKKDKKPNFAITDITDWTLSNTKGEVLLEWHKDENKIIKQESKINIENIKNAETNTYIGTWENIKLSKQENKDILVAQINYALDVGNKKEFIKLSEQYNKLEVI